MRVEQIGDATLYCGDSLEIVPGLPFVGDLVDSVVTDPPYGLSFMGKRWDYDVPSEALWAAVLEAMKPGANLLAFAGTRTQHRMAVRIEDAGFEIRDMIAWVYGSGFPKSLDVSKAIDKAAGAERSRIPRLRVDGKPCGHGGGSLNSGSDVALAIGPAITDAARQWQGWGTALKPALEPITVARKPLSGTVAETVLAHGTGALNIDGCRVATDDAWAPSTRGASESIGTFKTKQRTTEQHDAGRWPANLLHNGGEEVTGLLGEAARFFYCPKASKRDRDEGLEDMERKASGMVSNTSGKHITRRDEGYEVAPRANNHPTVKPTELMRYLCRLVTPPGGVVLDPFMGSGSTGKGAMLEGFRFIGIERDPDYFEIACRRIEAAYKKEN